MMSRHDGPPIRARIFVQWSEGRHRSRAAVSTPVARASVVATVALLLLSALSFPASTLAGSTFVVTRTDDPAPGPCLQSDCSLREAIIAANGAPGSTVQLTAGIYTLTRGAADTSGPNAARGDLDIMAAMAIDGAGEAATIVQFGTAKGTGLQRIFDVYSNSTVVIAQMTIRYGSDTDLASGGCIKNQGHLVLDSVKVSGCTSPRRGGGVVSYDTLTINDSLIENNSVDSTVTSGDTGGGGGLAGGRKPDGSPGTITVSNSVITGNTATNTGGSVAYGGGFSNVGIMDIESSVVSANWADSSAGGLSGKTGTLTITATEFSDNLATRDAGGLTTDGVLDVRDSTFSDNQAGYQCTGADCDQAFAGGLLSTGTATTTVENSTFSGNVCLLSGGGLLANATMTVRNSTIVDNQCDRGAGLSSNGGQTHIMNTILADNIAQIGGDCAGELTSDGYNLISTTKGCVISGDTTGNIVGADPLIGPLADNGGPTRTRALLATSPALNAGDPAGCRRSNGTELQTDERGYLRPAIGRCDIGAYERQSAVVVWTEANTAMAWQLNGRTFVGGKGYGGPSAAWTVQSFSRDPDGSYWLLWAAGNQAQLWHLTISNQFLSAKGFSGPGADYTATSVFFMDDRSYELLWSADNRAQIWTLNPQNQFAGVVRLTGPGAGWTATSYARASDGTRRVLWSQNNQARLWALSPSGLLQSSKGFGGPGAGWLASSFNLHLGGDYDLLWTTAGRAAIWSLDQNGSFVASLGLGGPPTWTAESFFFE